MSYPVSTHSRLPSSSVSPSSASSLVHVALSTIFALTALKCTWNDYMSKHQDFAPYAIYTGALRGIFQCKYGHRSCPDRLRIVYAARLIDAVAPIFCIGVSTRGGGGPELPQSIEPVQPVLPLYSVVVSLAFKSSVAKSVRSVSGLCSVVVGVSWLSSFKCGRLRAISSGGSTLRAAAPS